MTLKLSDANRIIAAVLARAEELDCRPMSVIVLEAGAVIKAFQKEDGASLIRFEMAYGKAYTALAMGRSSTLVRMRAEQRPIFMRFLIDTSDERLFPEGGGLQVRDATGEVLGAVGVTGDRQERDEELAAHGIQAAGLRTDDDFPATSDRAIGIRLTNE